MKGKTITELEAKYFGEPGTPEREQYELELNMELVGAKLSRSERTETIAAMKDAENGNVIKVDSVDELFDSI